MSLFTLQKIKLRLSIKKQADAAYLAFSGTLEKTNQNKQKAALKLDARNTGIRIAVRAKALPPDHTTQMRQLFWESEKGKELYSYVLMFKYSKKPHLAPFGLKFKVPSLSPEFIAVLTDEETINLSDIGVFFDSDAQEPSKKRGPGRPKKVQDQHKQDSEAAKEYFKESPQDTLQDESSDQVSLSDNLQEGGNT